MLSPLLISLALFINVHMFGLTGATSEPSTSPAGGPQSMSSSPLIATANLTGHFNVSGLFRFALQPDSNAVAVSISINGLNALNSTAAYAYHIHTNPISSDGNCASALGHLDPLAVTDGFVCNPQVSQYCQEGDLASRHGKLNGSEATLNVSYIDDYLRFWPQPFSILGRSVVVHLPNSTRIACGNITSAVDGTATAAGVPTLMSSNFTTQYPSQAPPAPPAKFEPFNGSTPNPEVLSQITLPSTLPTVQTSPNIMLGTNATTHMVNGKAEPVTLPAAVNATAPFTYTPGAALPSQNDTSINSTAGAKNSTDGAKQGASSGVERLAPAPTFSLVVILCSLISL
ncbi:hypothetical protein Pst134EA_028184 [Puccinia striiformis f. sp. tritici]|uniref:hypothetical protein n=1 Tax=Puccinia striiformis f. sp. tritici TaxID=168172 RepID=UPI00200790EA|nr:hypothetical protein Pst134EA_028184 [Puccinia striiformis f. sp. tritici]KAH9448892.1 hypothetical protein Pst134EA_028184 [Puccinia striiformis f. sp. tritici]KAI9617883.1 hypothetical protein H4Q26_012748 [Puccinia striiformis f. sp. tritici PST-130]